MAPRSAVDRVHEVYATSYRRLVGQLTGVTGDPVDAEDAVMEAFARAVNSSRSFLAADNPEAWLRTVAVNVTRTRWRRSRFFRDVSHRLVAQDSYAGMILPLLVDAAGVFIMKNFFESVPVSVEEQARIDGAGTFRLFWSVVLPMARPALITIVILSFQGSWNELSHFIISTQSPELTTLTKGVARLASGQLSQGTQYPLKLAAALIMTIPVAVLFFIFQRRIMNASEGAVKE